MLKPPSSQHYHISCRVYSLFILFEDRINILYVFICRHGLLHTKTSRITVRHKCIPTLQRRTCRRLNSKRIYSLDTRTLPCHRQWIGVTGTSITVPRNPHHFSTTTITFTTIITRTTTTNSIN